MKRNILLWTCLLGLLFSSCKETTDTASKNENYDLVVYGATSAGVIAAYTAKTMGKSVLLESPVHTWAA